MWALLKEKLFKGEKRDRGPDEIHVACITLARCSQCLVQPFPKPAAPICSRNSETKNDSFSLLWPKDRSARVQANHSGSRLSLNGRNYPPSCSPWEMYNIRARVTSPTTNTTAKSSTNCTPFAFLETGRFTLQSSGSLCGGAIAVHWDAHESLTTLVTHWFPDAPRPLKECFQQRRFILQTSFSDVHVKVLCYKKMSYY